MRNLIKRVIYGISWRVCRMYRKVFPHKVIKVKGGTIDNLIELGGEPKGKELNIVFNGKHNRVYIGANCHFLRRNTIFVVGDNNSVNIGDHTTFDGNVLLVPGEGTEINIGSDCMFANGVTIRTTDQHPIYDSNGIRANYAKNINIGNHVWLGAHTVVMKGINIGAGSVVGYGAMVTKSLPENCVAVGQPAHNIKNGIEWFRTFSQAPQHK